MSELEPHIIVVFGARGDLSKRMLLPGLARLARTGLMPSGYRIIGSGRHAPEGEWADEVAEILGEDTDPGFLERLSFVASSAEDGEDLAAAVAGAKGELGDDAHVLLYLSVPPGAAEAMVEMLGHSGLADGARIVMEKPFGRDAASARRLNAVVHAHFDEPRVFRIDHFLGKEAAQDILALRFANELFEPVWNRDHLDAVLIDVPEDLGLEGRGSFYDETGALRDMVVTHLVQLLALVAMERPSALEPEPFRDAKLAVFEDLEPLTEAVYGQFEGYQEEEDVAGDSTTETFVALRARIDNPRWRGVPFLLRTGKAMAESRTLVTLVLRAVSHDLFGPERAGPDEIAIELTDDPQLVAVVRVKRPGPTLEMARVPLRLDVARATDEHGLAAYERLLLDVMRGDQLLFTRADEIERVWERAAALLTDPPKPLPYPPGSWGPEPAHALAEPVGWRLPQDRALDPPREGR